MNQDRKSDKEAVAQVALKAVHSLAATKDVDQRFAWLEQLRLGALARLKADSNKNLNGVKTNSAALFNEESIAIQRQFEVLDRGLYGSLQVEKRESSYDQWKSEEDHDLPANPADLADEREAYKYALKRLYRRQFEVTLNEVKTGCWPLLLSDLMEPLDGKRELAISSAPLAVSNHNSPEYLRSMTSATIDGYVNVFDKSRKELAQRLAELTNSKSPESFEVKNTGIATVIIGAIAVLTQVIDTAYKIYRDVQDREKAEKAAREAQEAAEKQKAEKAAKEAQARAEKQMRDWVREPREIPGASDHCDSFERNQDRISRTC